MMEQYNLMMPKIVVNGKCALEQLPALIGDRYKRIALFTDKGIHASGITEYPLELMKNSKRDVLVFDELPAEPTCDEAQKVAEDFMKSGADYIVAIGGGSVMDIAKLASLAGTKEYRVRDLLETPLRGKKQVKTLMIPTTAGTGSEATPNSIVTVPEKNLKVGIVNPEMLADAVILDGRMLRKLPKKIGASTGIDALAHAIECFTSNKANPFSNLFALEALKLIFPNIIKACEDTEAVEEKNRMLLAAFYAGAAITASGTTAVHALSYPLGGRYHIPHGISNAIMLLPVLTFNREACLTEFGQIYDVIRGNCTEGRAEVKAEEKADWLLEQIEEILKRLEVPLSLKDYGIGDKDLEDLVRDGMEVKRLLVNNKRTVTKEDARNLYLKVM